MIQFESDPNFTTHIRGRRYRCVPPSHHARGGRAADVRARAALNARCPPAERRQGCHPEERQFNCHPEEPKATRDLACGTRSWPPVPHSRSLAALGMTEELPLGRTAGGSPSGLRPADTLAARNVAIRRDGVARPSKPFATAGGSAQLLCRVGGHLDRVPCESARSPRILVKMHASLVHSKMMRRTASITSTGIVPWRSWCRRMRGASARGWGTRFPDARQSLLFPMSHDLADDEREEKEERSLKKAEVSP
jgi:hypothetical protein